jgi:hypothetical protein
MDARVKPARDFIRLAPEKDYAAFHCALASFAALFKWTF